MLLLLILKLPRGLCPDSRKHQISATTSVLCLPGFRNTTYAPIASLLFLPFCPPLPERDFKIFLKIAYPACVKS